MARGAEPAKLDSIEFVYFSRKSCACMARGAEPAKLDSIDFAYFSRKSCACMARVAEPAKLDCIECAYFFRKSCGTETLMVPRKCGRRVPSTLDPPQLRELQVYKFPLRKAMILRLWRRWREEE